MIFVARPKKAPALLVGPHSAGRVEFSANKARIAANPAAELSFTVYKRPEIKLALDQIFKGKCAYCETRFGADSDGAVEHYRPKGRLIAEGHPGYWWLAAQWANLLLSCQHCNEVRGQIIVTAGMSMEEAARLHLEVIEKPTHGKGSQFPVRGVRRLPMSYKFDAEDALLIDPTRRDPREHLHFPPDAGISLAVPVETGAGPDAHGLATINVAALNRYRLVRERTGVLMDLRRHVLELESSLDAATAATSKAAKDAATERSTAALEAIAARAAPNRPYSSVAYFLHRRLIDWLREERDHGVQVPMPTLIDPEVL